MLVRHGHRAAQSAAVEAVSLEVLHDRGSVVFEPIPLVCGQGGSPGAESAMGGGWCQAGYADEEGRNALDG